MSVNMLQVPCEVFDHYYRYEPMFLQEAHHTNCISGISNLQVYMISVIQKDHFSPYLQVIECDVPQCLVHSDIVQCFLLKQKRCWTE